MANTGYHRFLAAPDGEGFTIDPVKVRRSVCPASHTRRGRCSIAKTRRSAGVSSARCWLWCCARNSLDRLLTRGINLPEWQHIIDDPADLSIEVEQDGRRALLRTAPRASIDPICRALDLALPPVFQEMPSNETPPNTHGKCDV